MGTSKYNLEQLGWFNFEQLVRTLLRQIIGNGLSTFSGSVDKGIRCVLSCLLAFPLINAACSSAQEADFGFPRQDIVMTPTSVSSGPLFFFNSYEEVSGARRDFLFAVDPSVSLVPQKVLSSDEDYGPCFRFSKDEFLFGRGLGIFLEGTHGASSIFLANIGTGSIVPLIPCGLTELVKIVDGKIYFREQEHSNRGFAPNPENINSGKPSQKHTRYRLFTYDTRTRTGPRVVCKECLLAVLSIDSKAAWVIDEADVPFLCRVDHSTGELRRIAPIPWNPFALPDCELSPDGKRIALGIQVEQGFLCKGRSLSVFDTSTRIKIFESSPICVDENYQELSAPLCPFPRLSFIWLDNSVIRYSETENAADGHFFRWVDVDIGTGKVLQRRRMMPWSSEQVIPAKGAMELGKPPDVQETEYFVLRSTSDLYYRKTGEIVLSRDDNYHSSLFSFSADGRWAAITSSARTMLIDGAQNRISQVYSWSFNHMWMPARD